MSVAWLPTLNALLNATTACLLVVGWSLIRRGRRQAHRRVMLGAVFTSALFLASYLGYHARVGSVRFAGQGPLRTAYLLLLLSHTVLAAAVGPLVVVALRRALKGRYHAHRRIAPMTISLWLWVSLSGVAVYWMLYRL